MEKKLITQHNRKRTKKIIIVKVHESNCKMIKSRKQIYKKRTKKQNISKIKWGHQNPRVVSCQTSNIKKYWIQG